MNRNVSMILANKYLKNNRVVIYCRVSTSSSSQLHSLTTQASYLTRYVANKIGWYLVDIYLDVGSGSSTDGRNEFNRMINDAQNKEFDILLVKNISRLGRDTENIVKTTRLLKEKEISVYFEEQEID